MDRKNENIETRELLDKFKEIILHLHAKLQVSDVISDRSEVAVDVAGDNVVRPENSLTEAAKLQISDVISDKEVAVDLAGDNAVRPEKSLTEAAKLQTSDVISDKEVAVEVAGDNVVRPENSKKKKIKIKHYSNKQKILLVGEGDFSFAVCLAKAFGNAENMVATSRDSKEDLVKHYPMAAKNLEELEKRGCRVVHCVDAHIMTRHRFLQSEHFDRIVFNFPHAGFQNKEHSVKQIKTHKKLVKGFFSSAKDMLTEVGEIHVTHKNAYPFSEWDLEGLAENVGLKLRNKVWFSLSDYEGYSNKRGSGDSWDETFPVGASFTFKFVLPKNDKK